MILFPFAKDIDYKDNTLFLTLEFFTEEAKTEVSLSIKLDNDVVDVIENLLTKEDSIGF